MQMILLPASRFAKNSASCYTELLTADIQGFIQNYSQSKYRYKVVLLR
jgi:hypothetical protein